MRPVMMPTPVSMPDTPPPPRKGGGKLIKLIKLIKIMNTDNTHDTHDTRVRISTLDLISAINIMIQTDGGHDGSGRIYITPNGIYYYPPTRRAAILDLSTYAGDRHISALAGQAADIAADWLQDHELIEGDIWALREDED